MLKKAILPSLFFISGATALVYEVIWLRILGQIFGNTTYAISIVLAVFMGGLGLGGYFLGKHSDHIRDRLKFYGILEIGIGLFAALTFVIQKGILAVYVHYYQLFGESLLLAGIARLVLTTFLFFIPTFLMGATFPLFMRFYTTKVNQSGRSSAFLYGLNTLGAFAGVILAGFVLLPALGMKLTLAIAVILNLAIGLIAIYLSRLFSGSMTLNDEPSDSFLGSGEHDAPVNKEKWILPAMVIAGAVAMVLEICWTRVLALIFGSSTYAFSLMLASFLLGIALGSMVMTFALKKFKPGARLWGLIFLVMIVSTISVFSIIDELNIFAVRLHAFAYGNYILWQILRFLAIGGTILIPAMCFGALFPLSVRLFTDDAQKISSSAGKVYLFNTIGNITGSLLTGFVLIPWLGIYATVWWALAVSLAIALCLFLIKQPATPGKKIVISSLSVMTAVLLLINTNAWNPYLLSRSLFYRPVNYFNKTSEQLKNLLMKNKVVFHEEGLNSLVSVIYYQTGGRSLYVNGKPDASTKSDMGTQLLSGHLPHLLHPAPKRSLIIGFGSGVTLAASLEHVTGQVDMVEIEEEVVKAGVFFSDVNRKSYEHPKANIIINDGRSHLLTATREYDVIVSEPSNPWMAGVSNLFTSEFYELVHSRLNQGGIFCQWISAYDISFENLRSVIASIRDVFPNVGLWRTPSGGDILIVASPSVIPYDLKEIAKRMKRSPEVKKDLERYQIRSAASYLPYEILDADEVNAFVDGSKLHVDNRLTLEFDLPKYVFDSQDSMGYVYRRLESFKADEKALTPDADRFKDKPYLLSYIGFGYLGRGHIRSARRFFNAALKVDNKHILATIGLARSYIRKKQYRSAEQILKKSMELFDKSSELRALYGRALLGQRKRKEAVPYLEKAIEKKPDVTEYKEWLANIYASLKQYDKATNLISELKDKYPFIMKYRLDYARLSRFQGKSADTLSYIESLFEDLPSFYFVFDELQAHYRELEMVDKQVETAETFIKSNPYNTESWKAVLDVYHQHAPERLELKLKQLRELNPYLASELQAKYVTSS